MKAPVVKLHALAPLLSAGLFLNVFGCGQQTLKSRAATTEASARQQADVTPLYGVTIDDISPLPSIVTSLANLPHRPTTRIVFDKENGPSYYLNAVTQISQASDVMGPILDSYDVIYVSIDEYLQRTDDFLAAMGDRIAIWEVGNEVNGEWLGTTADVVAKISGAYDRVKAAGRITELTLYYNQGCWSDRDHEMFTWANANIPDRMKQGLDYVLISYYEDDCKGLQPDWQTVFDQLAAMFPNSKIGIGECGTTIASLKESYIRRYYGMSISTPGYVGGYFWWYFLQDMVPYTRPLWNVLAEVMQ